MADLDFGPIREQFELEENFSPELEVAAQNATDRFAESRIDARDIALVTIDLRRSCNCCARCARSR